MSAFLDLCLGFGNIFFGWLLGFSFSAHHIESDFFEVAAFVVEQRLESFLFIGVDLRAPHQRNIELLEVALCVDDERVQGIDDCTSQTCLRGRYVNVLERLDLAQPVNHLDESLVSYLRLQA